MCSSDLLGSEMDKVEATPTRLEEQIPWDDEAKAILDELVDGYPVLTRISAAKQLRDKAERQALEAGEGRVTAARMASFDGARKLEPVA